MKAVLLFMMYRIIDSSSFVGGRVGLRHLQLHELDGSVLCFGPSGITAAQSGKGVILQCISGGRIF